jgi:hypothetical protein
MFTIYQIHEKGGEYEYRFDNIVGSYLHKERAERELEKFKDALNERCVCYQKCSNCSAQFGCLEDEIDEIRENCDHFSTENDESLIVFCKNAVYSYDESVRYEIEETDVDDEEVKE